MNSNLRTQYDILLQSTINLNFVTNEFLKKLRETSSNFAQEFIINKKDRNELLELERNDDAILMIYKDSIMQRFLNCYADTFKFLSLYLDTNFLIRTDKPLEIILHCLDNKIINLIEFKKFQQLAEDYNNIIQSFDAQISEEVIPYCLLMCEIVRRFKN
jgi:hypothetical protein